MEKLSNVHFAEAQQYYDAEPPQIEDGDPYTQYPGS